MLGHRESKHTVTILATCWRSIMNDFTGDVNIECIDTVKAAQGPYAQEQK